MTLAELKRLAKKCCLLRSPVARAHPRHDRCIEAADAMLYEPRNRAAYRRARAALEDSDA